MLLLYFVGFYWTNCYFNLFPVHVGERYQKLLAVLQMVEREKTRQTSAAQGLQEKLIRAQEEISSLQTSITERSSHYQQLHNQLLDKATQATSLEKEVSIIQEYFISVVHFMRLLTISNFEITCQLAFISRLSA